MKGCLLTCVKHWVNHISHVFIIWIKAHNRILYANSQACIRADLFVYRFSSLMIEDEVYYLFSSSIWHIVDNEKWCLLKTEGLWFDMGNIHILLLTKKVCQLLRKNILLKGYFRYSIEEIGTALFIFSKIMEFIKLWTSVLVTEIMDCFLLSCR